MSALEELRQSLAEGPDKEIVILHASDGLEELTVLPPLPVSAARVELYGFARLEHLSVGAMLKLRGLVVEENDRMAHFPHERFQPTLEELRLLHWRALIDLPPLRPTCIHTLDLTGCERLEVVPAFPDSMRSAILKGCRSARRLEGLNQGLQMLSVEDCSALEEVVGPYPTSLKYLVMRGCNPRIVPRPEDLPLGCQCIAADEAIFKGLRVPPTGTD
jgi:hypothetical protein